MGARGLILWLMAGASVFLIYAAVQNINPEYLILHYLGQTPTTIAPEIQTTSGNTDANLTPQQKQSASNPSQVLQEIQSGKIPSSQVPQYLLPVTGI
jgi:hypothetical protein